MLDAPVTIAYAIQLAVAPVFLLTGIAGMLAVLTHRLARIIDRSRQLHDLTLSGEPERQAINEELATLARRARLSNRAITLCTTSALLVSLVIAVIFLSFFIFVKMSMLIAFLFVAATFTFILALLHFLREVQLATQSLRILPLTALPPSQANRSPLAGPQEGLTPTVPSLPESTGVSPSS